MELIFNDAKIRQPKHLERCLCYDKFLKGYRCYVYDDISKYWCTQATTEHDPDGENHIVDYADYQVTEWASLQQEQPDVDIREEIKKLEFMGSNDARDIEAVAKHFYELGLKSK